MAPPEPRLTKARLWFLYCVAGLLQREVQELTGWSRGRIAYRLRAWNLTMRSEAFWETQLEIRVQVALALRIPADVPSASREICASIQATLRRRLLARGLSWNEVDRVAVSLQPDLAHP